MYASVLDEWTSEARIIIIFSSFYLQIVFFVLTMQWQCLRTLVLRIAAPCTSQRLNTTIGARVTIVFGRSVARSVARSLGSVGQSLDRSISSWMPSHCASHGSGQELKREFVCVQPWAMIVRRRRGNNTSTQKRSIGYFVCGNVLFASVACLLCDGCV